MNKVSLIVSSFQIGANVQDIVFEGPNRYLVFLAGSVLGVIVTAIVLGGGNKGKQ